MDTPRSGASINTRLQGQGRGALHSTLVPTAKAAPGVRAWAATARSAPPATPRLASNPEGADTPELPAGREGFFFGLVQPHLLPPCLWHHEPLRREAGEGQGVRRGACIGTAALFGRQTASLHEEHAVTTLHPCRWLHHDQSTRPIRAVPPAARPCARCPRGGRPWGRAGRAQSRAAPSPAAATPRRRCRTRRPRCPSDAARPWRTRRAAPRRTW